MSQPWLSFSHTDDGRPMTEREWQRVIDGVRGQMQAHDAKPARVRELVGEHNIGKGLELWRRELLATTEKCRHGRFPASCAQCHYDQHRR